MQVMHSVDAASCYEDEARNSADRAHREAPREHTGRHAIQLADNEIQETRSRGRYRRRAEQGREEIVVVGSRRRQTQSNSHFAGTSWFFTQQEAGSEGTEIAGGSEECQSYANRHFHAATASWMDITLMERGLEMLLLDERCSADSRCLLYRRRLMVQDCA